MTELGTFEGRDVIQQKVKLGGSATGLNEALTVEPMIHHPGEEVTMLVRGRIVVGFEEVKDTDCLARVETVKITAGAFVDESLATDTLQRQAELIEQAKGIQRLALEPNKAAIEAHQRGEHPGDDEFGCPLCDEATMAAQEAREEAERAAEGKAGPAPKPARGARKRGGLKAVDG